MNSPEPSRGDGRWPAAVTLLTTAAVALVWSHAKLMWVDELLELETDRVSTAWRVVQIQRRFPVNIDPAIYHVTSHFSTLLFGANAFAVRLPSLLGFLLMQLCVYLFAKRLVGVRAAVVAMIFPALTAALLYAAEGRPYGMLLGLFGLALWLYQTATRESSRNVTLVALALVLAATPNTHYFGVLLFLPLGAAELVRTIERRKLDFALVGAMLFGIVVGMAAILPFRAAAQRYRDHYYNANTVGPREFFDSYYFLLVNAQGELMHRVGMLLIGVALLAVVVAVVRRRRDLPGHELVLVSTLALLPLFAYLIARYATHTMEMRYTLGAVPAIGILLAIAIAPILARDSAYRAAVGLGLVASVVIGCLRVSAEKRKSDAILASLVVAPEMKAALLSRSDTNIYFEEAGYFQVARYYEPDAEVRDHLRLIYDEATELRVYRRDTNSLTADHLLQFTDLPIVPYSMLKDSPVPHHVVMYHSVWDWTHQALAHDGAQVTPLGSAFGGEAVTATFPAQQ